MVAYPVVGLTALKHRALRQGYRYYSGLKRHILTKVAHCTDYYNSIQEGA